MPLVVPRAHRLDARTGEYSVTDVATSGGDIGAQVLMFPVVWVRFPRYLNRLPLPRSPLPFLILLDTLSIGQGQEGLPWRPEGNDSSQKCGSRVRLGGLFIQQARVDFCSICTRHAEGGKRLVQTPKQPRCAPCPALFLRITVLMRREV